MRHALLQFLIPGIILATALPASADDAPRVFVEERQLTGDTQSLTVAGTVMLPVRATFEALGFTVAYYAEEQRIDLTSPVVPSARISLWTGKSTLRVNTHELALASVVLEADSRTYVSADILSRLGCRYRWDEQDGSLWIYRPLSPEQEEALYKAMIKAFSRLQQLRVIQSRAD
ncbi:MAG TPA: copper amine oxidase N-terminal domain-containing protein [Symbiobacteriaceae bacterium]|nr:copper amine oxidase N-terminal domain-containing protein [Symbiobacteriaceae bacterium]